MIFNKLKLFSTSIIIALCFFACSNSELKHEDIIGVWLSTDGAKLEFKNNNFIEINNYPLRLNNSNFKGMLNGKGTWEIIKDRKGNWKNIQISAENSTEISELLSKGIAIDLFISRSGFFNNGAEIDNLFIWIGDPDLAKRYKFMKQKRD